MKPYPIIAVIALSAALVAPVAAHHSLAAAYRLAAGETIRGTVLQVTFREPHTYVHVEAPDAEGVLRRWSLEWSDTQTLLRSGVARDTLRPGDQVEVLGHPGRNPESHQLLIVHIIRAHDGWSWGDDESDTGPLATYR
jgi:hypothetical protein